MSLTLTSVLTGGSRATLTGGTISNLSLSPSQGCPWSGDTQAQADTILTAAVARAVNGTHLALTKKFWGTSNFDTTKNDLANYAAFGTKVILCLQPAFNPTSSGDLSSLGTFLNYCKNTLYLDAIVVLWQEAGSAANNMTPQQYLDMHKYYGPTVRAYYQLWADLSYSTPSLAEHPFTDYANALISGVPGDSAYPPDGLAIDYYATEYLRSTPNLITDASAIADAASLPFGVFEYGAPITSYTQAQITTYMNYVSSFAQARAAAGKSTFGVAWYQGCSPTSGSLTSPILTSSDYRAPLYGATYDAVTQNTWQTASWTPVTTDQYLLGVNATAVAATPPPVPVVTGNGLTWQLIASKPYGTGGPRQSKLFLFAAAGTGGTAGVTTITFGPVPVVTSAGWALDQVAGADPGLSTGTLPQTAAVTSGTATAQTGTLSTVQTGDVSYGFFGAQGTSATGLTAGAGMTALGSAAATQYAYVLTEYGSASPSASWPAYDGGTAWGAGIAIEIPALGVSGPTGGVSPDVYLDTYQDIYGGSSIIPPPPPPPPPPPSQVYPSLVPVTPWRFLWGAPQPAGGWAGEFVQAQSRVLTMRAGPTTYHQCDIDMLGTDLTPNEITELETDFQVMYGDVLLFAGRLAPTQDTLDNTGHRVTLTALDYKEILRRRALVAAANYTSVDPALMAWNLVQLAQARAGGNLGITRGAGQSSGGTQTFNAAAGDYAGADIDTIAQMVTGAGDTGLPPFASGFDWDITPYAPDDLRLDLFYPPGVNKGVVFTPGDAQVSSITRVVDPSTYGDEVYVTGNSGSSLTPQLITVPNVGVLPQGLWDLVIGTSITTSGALAAAAQWFLNDAQVVTPTYTVVLYPGAWRGPSHIWLRDTVTIQISSGRLQVNVQLQVSEMEFDVSADGRETLTLTIGRVPWRIYQQIPKMLRRLRRLETQ